MAGTTEAFYFPLRTRNQELLVEDAENIVTVHPVLTSELDQRLEAHGPQAKAWAATCKFKAKSGETCVLPSPEGGVLSALLGLEQPSDLWAYAAISARLPGGPTYRVDPAFVAQHPGAADAAALGFLLGHYAFDRYKKPEATKAVKAAMVWPQGCNRAEVLAVAEALTFARDLITTPAEDMGPQHMCAEASALASHHGASLSLTTGDDLLAANYPAVHTVGRAAARPPALIDIRWRPAGTPPAAQLPLLALVGKGVCFDSGGLDIKTAAGMKLMKGDMAGGASVLGLAHMLMSRGLGVELRLLLPAVENAISGNAYRPLDVLRTRAGLTVENGNTDAEGRLILSDCLFEAASQDPDLLIDIATLTGAARAALGPEVPAVFTNDDQVWRGLEAAAAAESDPLWRMPLHKGYRKALDSKVADIASYAEGGVQAGAVTAALFLQEFAKAAPRWVHIDTAAFVSGQGAGRPDGGESLASRAVWHYLKARYGLAGGQGK